MGKRQGIFDESSLLTMCQTMLEIIAGNYDFGIIECTQLLDVAVLQTFLGEIYDIQSCVFSPTMLGVPVSRHRFYADFVRKEKGLLKWTNGPSASFGYHLQQCFGCPCSLQGSIYFDAEPPALRKDMFSKIAIKKGYPSLAPGGKPWHFKDVACSGSNKRVAGFLSDIMKSIEAGKRKGDDWSFNIAQTIGHTTVSTNIPALLTGSVVYNTKWHTVLSPLSHFVVQGIPMWHHENFPHGRPLQDTLKELPDTVMKRMCGMSFHMSQLHASLYYLLSHTTYVTDEDV